MAGSLDTLIIGVDGGGSGCRVAIGSLAGGELSRAEGGPANVSSDLEVAVRNVVATVEAAAADLGVSRADLGSAVAHLGLAGVMTDDDARSVASLLPYRLAVVTDDRPTALNGALGGEDGFLLSVGTGTIAAASTNGVVRSVGGWGFWLGDDASGSWLGQQCLRQVLLCHDGLAEHSDLTAGLLRRFEDDPIRIVAFSLSANPGDYGAFAPDVVEGARRGDPIGRQIMRAGAAHLCGCLSALEFKTGDALCLTGGVGPHYIDYLPDDVKKGLRTPSGDALDGAFRFAKDHVGKLARVSS